jgi:hypothetical protein
MLLSVNVAGIVHTTSTDSMGLLIDAVTPQRVRSQSSSIMLSQYAIMDEHARRLHMSVDKFSPRDGESSTQTQVAEPKMPVASHLQQITSPTKDPLEPSTASAVSHASAPPIVHSQPITIVAHTGPQPYRHISVCETRPDIFTVSLGTPELRTSMFGRGSVGVPNRPPMLGFRFNLDAEHRLIVTGYVFITISV